MRLRIATAACVVASGLFVGGANATLAFADSGPVHAAEGGGTQASPPNVGATAPTSGDRAEEPTAQPTSGGTATAGAPKLTSQVGDGRHGRHTGVPRASAPSKSSTPDPAGTGFAGPPTEDPDDPDNLGHHHGEGQPCWRSPPVPDQPPVHSGGGGHGGSQTPPRGRPTPPAPMQLPVPGEVLVDAVTDVTSAVAELPLVPITLPVIVDPLGAGGAGGGAGAGGDAGGSGIGPRPATPSAPPTSGTPGNVGQPPQTAGQPNPPASGASNEAAPASLRAGYGDYLRTAGIGKMAAVAVPGITGILIITAAGALLGYRQARAGHAVRANATARFVS